MYGEESAASKLGGFEGSWFERCVRMKHSELRDEMISEGSDRLVRLK